MRYEERRRTRDLPQRNPHNQLINPELINRILHEYGVHQSIRQLSIYQTAFVHESYLQKHQNENESHLTKLIAPFEQSYERLEFLGDAILNSVIGTYLYIRYPDQDEGFMTKLKSKLVRESTCAELCRQLGLVPYIILARYLEENHDLHSRLNHSIQEDVFEAFLGAIFSDFGFEGEAYEICRVFITNLYERHIDFSHLIDHDDNYKDQLLRYFHRNFNQEHPQYQLMAEEDKGRHHYFKVGVVDTTGTIIGVGTSIKKHMAEQLAAQDALKSLRVI